MIKKITIIFFIISIIFTSNIYADTYSELINKILYIEKQRIQREPIEIKLKGCGYGGGDITYIYNTSVMKIKEVKPKEK